MGGGEIETLKFHEPFPAQRSVSSPNATKPLTAASSYPSLLTWGVASLQTQPQAKASRAPLGCTCSPGLIVVALELQWKWESFQLKLVQVCQSPTQRQPGSIAPRRSLAPLGSLAPHWGCRAILAPLKLAPGPNKRTCPPCFPLLSNKRVIGPLYGLPDPKLAILAPLKLVLDPDNRSGAIDPNGAWVGERYRVCRRPAMRFLPP